MYIVGIAGGTCSGKTTITAKLHESIEKNGYKVKVIALDSYFKNPTPIVVAPFTGIEYSDHNHPDSFNLDLFYADVISAQNSTNDILILEGLLILYLEKIRRILDLKVFMDLKSDERLIRRIKRFMAMRGDTLDDVASRYLDTVRYRHDEFVEPSRWFADIIINGALNLNNGSDILLSYILNTLSK